MRKTLQKKRDDYMDEAECREVLEAIARDPEAYPRDRIAAIKTLEEMRYAEPAAGEDPWADSTPGSSVSGPRPLSYEAA